MRIAWPGPLCRPPTSAGGAQSPSSSPSPSPMPQILRSAVSPRMQRPSELGTPGVPMPQGPVYSARGASPLPNSASLQTSLTSGSQLVSPQGCGHRASYPISISSPGMVPRHSLSSSAPRPSLLSPPMPMPSLVATPLSAAAPAAELHSRLQKLEESVEDLRAELRQQRVDVQSEVQSLSSAVKRLDESSPSAPAGLDSKLLASEHPLPEVHHLPDAASSADLTEVVSIALGELERLARLACERLEEASVERVIALRESAAATRIAEADEGGADAASTPSSSDDTKQGLLQAVGDVRSEEAAQAADDPMEDLEPITLEEAPCDSSETTLCSPSRLNDLLPEQLNDQVSAAGTGGSAVFEGMQPEADDDRTITLLRLSPDNSSETSLPRPSLNQEGDSEEASAP
eukprot:TRINITY_DN70174_c0_g1_i1.p1 TRINITY_DN70174_c0_g1~~TRINITY_DN70174_c0_g1_i1.p1  ORF type:complete len:403 (-),score=70.73 TRINITY_DN70174_c0_g1_i1:200-1408(-)